METQQTVASNGVDTLVPRERMTPSARTRRDTYARVPGAPLFKREFGYFCLERWREQGMPQDVPFEELFDYDPPGNHKLEGLGCCEAGFSPEFEEKVLEDRGEHEVVQDFADLEERMRAAREQAAKGLMITRRLVGGYIPTCDHGVPEEVPYENYLHYRTRCVELGG